MAMGGDMTMAPGGPAMSGMPTGGMPPMPPGPMGPPPQSAMPPQPMGGAPPGPPTGAAPMDPMPAQPMPPGGGMGGQGIDQNGVMDILQNVVAAHGEELEGLYQRTATQLQRGSLTMPELNQLGAMAVTAIQDPRIYAPAMQAAQAEGIIGEVPEQPDIRMLAAIALVAGRAQQEMGGQPQTPQQQQQAPQGAIPSMRGGGVLPHKIDSRDEGMNVRLHAGEAVLPADVVRRMGTDKIDKMMEPPKPKKMGA